VSVLTYQSKEEQVLEHVISQKLEVRPSKEHDKPYNYKFPI